LIWRAGFGAQVPSADWHQERFVVRSQCIDFVTVVARNGRRGHPHWLLAVPIPFSRSDSATRFLSEGGVTRSAGDWSNAAVPPRGPDDRHECRTPSCPEWLSHPERPVTVPPSAPLSITADWAVPGRRGSDVTSNFGCYLTASRDPSGRGERPQAHPARRTATVRLPRCRRGAEIPTRRPTSTVVGGRVPSRHRRTSLRSSQRSIPSSADRFRTPDKVVPGPSTGRRRAALTAVRIPWPRCRQRERGL